MRPFRPPYRRATATESHKGQIRMASSQVEFCHQLTNHLRIAQPIVPAIAATGCILGHEQPELRQTREHGLMKRPAESLPVTSLDPRKAHRTVLGGHGFGPPISMAGPED